MPGMLRRKRVRDARHELTFRQREFIGQNIDHPSSELGSQDGTGYTSSILSRIENAICRGKFIEPRKGGERFSYANMPGSGEILGGPIQHPTTQKFLLHRGTSLWIADEDANYWEELTARSADAVPGTRSTISFFDDDFVVFTNNGHFLTYLENTQYFKLNSNNPINRIMDDPSPGFTVNNGDWSEEVTNDATADWTLGTAKYVPSGTPVTLSTTGTLPTEFAVNTVYYVIRDPNENNLNTEIALAASHDDSINGVPIVSSETGSGTHTINGVRDAYKYRYFYTFLRMLKTDGTSAAGLDRRDSSTAVLSETGIKTSYGAGTRDWGTIVTSLPASECNPVTINLNYSENFATTDVSVADDTVTTEGQYDTGMIVTLSTTGTLPSGLSTSTDYYVINSTTGVSNTIKFATSLSNALAGTDINIGDVGAGTHTITVTGNKNKDSAHTHIGIYRTLNISSSTPDGFDPVTNEGNNPEVASWVGDADISDNTFVDKTDDDKLRGEIATGRFLAKMRGFSPLPNGDVGVVGQGWLAVATRDKPTLSYSSTSELQKTFAGHYSPLQFHKFDQGIQRLSIIEDNMIVQLSNQTKPVTLTSWRNSGLLEFVPVLDHFPDGDKTLGVLDYGTIAEVEKGTIIAVCSDHSVRMWNGSRWGEDLSHDLVNTEIRKMLRGSVSAYFAGRYYIWYRTDEDATYNNKCLRLGITKEAGLGWSFITGSQWIYPPLYTGSMLAQDKNGIQKLLVLDAADKYIYWIDTFDSYTGSQTAESFADKKIDGGFCALGSKYWYDEMDNNSQNGELSVGTVGNGAATEQNQHMEIVSDQDNGDKARVLLNKEINTGDIDASVRHTNQVSTGGNMVSWEVKVADFSSDTDQIDINDLNQGFLAYVKGNPDNTGVYTAYWNFIAGSTQVTGSIPLSGRPNKLQVKRDSNTISVFANNKQVTSDTNTAWGTLSGMKASFAYDANTGSGAGRAAGFNAFYVVSDQMGSDCLGTDGLGSSTVSSPKRIASLMRFMEISGQEESHNVKHRESHAYFRPTPSTLTYFHPAFTVGWKSYKDNGDTPVESVTNVQYSGDIQNWREIEGRRIQMELNTNLSKWRMVGLDSHYWSEDKKNLEFDPGSTVEADWQEELATGLDFWLARGNYLLDRATGNTMTETGTGSAVIGPDSDDRGAFKFDGAVVDDDATEILTNGALTGGTSWSAAQTASLTNNRCEISDGDDYNLEQAFADLAAGDQWATNQWYRLKYDASNLVGTVYANVNWAAGGSLPPSGMMTVVEGTDQVVYFKSGPTDGDYAFILERSPS